jgi:hypothetical protein
MARFARDREDAHREQGQQLTHLLSIHRHNGATSHALCAILLRFSSGSSISGGLAWRAW